MSNEVKHAWNVIGVFAAEDTPDDFEPFMYTVGLYESFGLPELWCRCLGECGHRVAMEGLHYVLNTIADKLTLHELDPGDTYKEIFNPSNATLSFVIGTPEEGVDPEKYQTFQANPQAPVCAVTWTCCQGK